MSEFIEGVLSNFDKGNAVSAVFLKLSKTFGSVDRNILLRKLEFYGVRGNMHLLISSYLDERNSSLALEDMNQPVKKIEVGVPQGSVLAPFIKNTYLNGSESFNTELKKVSDWLIGNKLKLNLNKTRSMILHQSKNSFWKNIDLNVK